jgi:hypothetical protein
MEVEELVQPVSVRDAASAVYDGAGLFCEIHSPIVRQLG